MNFFDTLNEWINNTEGSVVNFLTAFAPWLAPLIPAYMTYDHMVKVLLFDNWLAWVGAGVVEILGFSTVSTGLDFWFFNRANTAKKKQAPLSLVFISFGFYLLLIVVSNVVIDAAKEFDLFEKDLQVAVLLVRALLTLQTIPAVLIVAARTGHRDILQAMKKEKAERKANNVVSVPTQRESNFDQTLTSSQVGWRKASINFTTDQKQFLLNNTPAAIMKEFSLASIQTASNWQRYAKRDFL